jgi:5-methylthioadenosine/S-adenosylhomocysteine deaminase
VSALIVQGCDALVAPNTVRRGVDIVMEGNRIATVEPTDRREPASGAEVLSGRGLLAMPGLVNAHTHSPENCLRGSGEGLPLELWLTRMFGTAGAFSPEDHYVCALAGAVEMLLTGTTATLDHLWMTPPTVPAAEAVLRAYRDCGIRAAVAPLVADVDFTEALATHHGLDLSGALFTDLAPPVPADEAQAQLEELLGRWHDCDGRRLQVFAGPCGVQWCSDELLVRLAETARRHETAVTMHLLETAIQDEVCRLRFGDTAVRALDQLGLLSPRCSLAHSVWVGPQDIELLADRGAIVVHNPAANFRLGSGRAPIPDLMDAGARIALGADGSASSDNQVMWTQLKLAALIHNGTGDRWVSGAQALEMATVGGAAALGLPNELGRIEAGARADVVLLDQLGEGLMGVQEISAGLALSETGRGVVHVVVGGELVVRDRRCTRVDEDGLRAAVVEQVAKRRDRQQAVPRPTLEAMEKLARLRSARGGGPVREVSR